MAKQEPLLSYQQMYGTSTIDAVKIQELIVDLFDGLDLVENIKESSTYFRPAIVINNIPDDAVITNGPRLQIIIPIIPNGVGDSVISYNEWKILVVDNSDGKYLMQGIHLLRQKFPYSRVFSFPPNLDIDHPWATITIRLPELKQLKIPFAS